MSENYRDEIEQFSKDGFILVPNLLVPEEVKILVAAAHGDDKMLGSAFELADTGGARIRLSGWNQAGDDTFGLIARLPRIVDRMEAFLGGEVYHYHSKMILKEPPRRRRMGVASGLWILVSKWMPVSRYGKLSHCHRSGNAGKWLS